MAILGLQMLDVGIKNLKKLPKMKKLKSIIKKIFTTPERDERRARVRYEETEKIGFEIERKRTETYLSEQSRNRIEKESVLF